MRRKPPYQLLHSRQPPEKLVLREEVPRPKRHLSEDDSSSSATRKASLTRRKKRAKQKLDIIRADKQAAVDAEDPCGAVPRLEGLSFFKGFLWPTSIAQDLFRKV